jgi:alpha-L-fucosidase
MPLTRRSVIRQTGAALLMSRSMRGLLGQTGASAGSRDAYAAPKPMAAGPFAPTWESLRDLYQVPAWFSDAKFGIFIHWGLYSIPAHGNEWYERHMYQETETAKWHAEHYGPTDKFGYKDFIPLLTVPAYQPAEWADLFVKCGAKYVIPVAEHHDGFAMYDSDLTPWCAGKMGPKRDLMGELAREVRKRNLIFGCSSHRMEHDSFAYPANNIPNDEFDPKYAGFYGPPVPGEFNNSNASKAFQEDWLARVQELVNKYEPQMIYFDNGVNTRAYDDVKLRAAAYYYNRAHDWGKGATLATKDVAYLFGSVQDFEKQDRAPKAIYNAAGWQCDDSLGSTWGYTDGMTVRSAVGIVRELVEMVSLGGNLLLNISPKGDGSIPTEQQRELLAVGGWLKVNGEGIYGTRAWRLYGEGPRVPRQSPGDWKGGSTDRPGPKVARQQLPPLSEADFRFTAGGGALYAFGYVRPKQKALLTTFAEGRAKVERVTLLGDGATLSFTQTQAGLEVALPPVGGEMHAALPYCLKINGSMPMGQAGA